jgi:hypothetical protein
MRIEERKLLIKSMHERSKKATASKEAAVQYLIKLGILTKNGKPSKHYKELIGFLGLSKKSFFCH